jgi:hypothetical protein
VDRLAFWQRLHQRLAQLANRVDAATQARVLAAVHARVPMVTADEQRTTQLDNAKADQTFWNTVADLHAGTLADQQQLAASVEHSIASGTAEIAKAKESAEAAAERIARIERGEDVAGGLGKSPTMDEILQAAGLTAADRRHCELIASIPEEHFKDYLQESWRLREKLDRRLSTRAARTVLRRYGA